MFVEVTVMAMDPVHKINIVHLVVDTAHGGVKRSDAWEYFGRLVFQKGGLSKHLLKDKVFCSLCLAEAKDKIGFDSDSDDGSGDSDPETETSIEHAFGR